MLRNRAGLLARADRSGGHHLLIFLCKQEKLVISAQIARLFSIGYVFSLID